MMSIQDDYFDLSAELEEMSDRPELRVISNVGKYLD